MEKYVNEILEYQDILKLQIERETHDFNGALSEKEMIYNDINEYCDKRRIDYVFIKYNKNKVS